MSLSKNWSRRRLLRAAGVTLALPWLESLGPVQGRSVNSTATSLDSKPRRIVGICDNIGVLPQNFFPEETGRDYQLSPYLKILEQHRHDFTVFTGVSHPDVDAGHPADVCFLSAAPHPGSSGFRNSISLDQYAAERVGHLTRFPSLTLGVNVKEGVRSLSITRSGAMIPCENKASELFRKLFVQGSPEQISQQLVKLQRGESILDAIAGQAQSLDRISNIRDRDRIDQYFTSVRDLENRMLMSRAWEDIPRPHVNQSQPVDPPRREDYMTSVKLMYDMTRLALETDSTRCISLMLDSMSSPAIEFGDKKFTDSYHYMSHHGRSEKKLELLQASDEMHMRLLNDLLSGLKSVNEGEETLLDRTMLVYGSNMNSANTHATTNLPILFAGGGFRHGQHLKFDTDHNYPLPNLFVSMLQRMGIETDKFASATGTMRGLEMT